MMYRVVLRIKIQEDRWMQIGSGHDILWDVRDLIEASSGWTVLNQDDIGPANSFLSLLERGIWELTKSADAYQDYEVMYGLGTIRDTLAFYRSLLEDCKEHPYTELFGKIVT